MDAFDWITVALVSVGCFLAFTGALGVVRMPDFYTRLHPAGKSDTLGQALILVGLAFQAGDLFVVLKLLLIIGILFVTAPTATHAITKAAWEEGLRPWTKGGSPDPSRDYGDGPPTEVPATSSPQSSQGEATRE